MPDQIESTAGVPSPQPAVDQRVSASDPAPEIPPSILRKLHEITVTRFEVNRRAATDKCVQSLMKKLVAAKAAEVPSRLEIDAQKKAVIMVQQRYNHLLSLHERKKANIQMLEAQLHHRLATIQESLEALKIRRIRGKMRPVFRRAVANAESVIEP